jgi:phosphoribosylformylglycinamidine cyclo-ligase
MDYKSAGVDVAAGDALVEWLKETAPSKMPHADKLVSGIGGFASLFRFKFPQMSSPLIVSSTDGVGTKVKLASHFRQFDTVGQDLVAMCVNDLVCCGAQPLFFLDYYAMSRLVLDEAKAFLQGVRQACLQSNCALIGGETAEMPDVYQNGDFDCAGFVVGVVDEPLLLGVHRVRVGDHVIGVPSSGFHSNGFSLLRKVFADDLEKWRESLMMPTTLYVAMMEQMKKLTGLKAAANITGGGMENIPRVLPEGTCLRLQRWDWPEPFQEVARRTGMSREEMLKTLNCGVGLALVVSADQVAAARTLLSEQGFHSYPLGVIEASRQTESHIIYEGA